MNILEKSLDEVYLLYHDSWVMLHATLPIKLNGALTLLAPQERPPELPIMPCEKSHTGAAA